MGGLVGSIAANANNLRVLGNCDRHALSPVARGELRVAVVADAVPRHFLLYLNSRYTYLAENETALRCRRKTEWALTVSGG